MTPLFRLVLPALLLSAWVAPQVSAQEYHTFKARNNVAITYTVLLPDGYRAGHAYPTAVVFAGPDARRQDTETMLHTFWDTPADRAGWIVVAPLTPGDDWRTHPNHHALNDLMDEIRQDYSVDGDFHIVGTGSDGVSVATTWAGMSKEYFSTLIAVDGEPFDGWDDDDAVRWIGDDKPHILLIRSVDAGSYERFDALIEAAGSGYGIIDGLTPDELQNGGVLSRATSWINEHR